VDALLEAMSSHLLAEWIAYAGLEPFGDELLDAHLAQLNANMINKDRKRSARVDPNAFRLRKPERGHWDPQDWFSALKDAFGLGKGHDRT
jgi:hypothetical protein